MTKKSKSGTKSSGAPKVAPPATAETAIAQASETEARTKPIVKAAGSGSSGKSSAAPGQAGHADDVAHERPSASEPSLPDTHMPDPTRQDQPGPARAPSGDSDTDGDSPVPGENQRPGPVEEPTSKPIIRASDQDDFVTPPPHSAPQPSDQVAGHHGQTSEVKDDVGPRADVEPEAKAGTGSASAAAAHPTADKVYYSLHQMRDVMGSMTSGLADLRLAGNELRSMSEAAQSATVKGLCALAEELQSLTCEAMERQRETTRALMSAKSLPEAWEVQYRAVQQAMENYSDHIRELNAIGIDTFHRATEPMTSGMTQSLTRFWRMPAA